MWPGWFFLVLYQVLDTGHVTLPWLFGAWSGAGALVGLYTFRAHWARSTPARCSPSGCAANGRSACGSRAVHARDPVDLHDLLPAPLRHLLAGIGEIKLSQLARAGDRAGGGLQSALIALAAKRFQRDTREAVRFLALGGVSGRRHGGLERRRYPTPVHAMTGVFGPKWPARPLVPYTGLGVTSAVSPGVPLRGCGRCAPPAITSGSRSWSSRPPVASWVGPSSWVPGARPEAGRRHGHYVVLAGGS